MTAGANSLSLSVIEAVAEAEGVDPVDLATPLAEAVNPDALNLLFQDGTGQITFEYSGYQVTAGATGTVQVTPLTDA